MSSKQQATDRVARPRGDGERDDAPRRGGEGGGEAGGPEVSDDLQRVGGPHRVAAQVRERRGPAAEQLAGVLRAPGPVGGERALDHLDERLGQVGPPLPQRGELAVADAVEHREHAVRLERAPPGEHLVDQRAEAEDVGPRVDRARVADLLGGHVRGRPDEDPGRGAHRRVLAPLHHAEVGDLRDRALAGAPQQDVGRLEVAMDQPLGVRRRDPRRDAPEEVVDLRHRQPHRAEHRGQVGPVHELHHQAVAALDLQQVGDVGDVRMPQPALGLPFEEEALRVARVGVHQLERVRAAEGRVAHPIHGRHTTRTERALDDVARDDVAGLQHERTIPDPALGLGVGHPGSGRHAEARTAGRTNHAPGVEPGRVHPRRRWSTRRRGVPGRATRRRSARRSPNRWRRASARRVAAARRGAAPLRVPRDRRR